MSEIEYGVTLGAMFPGVYDRCKRCGSYWKAGLYDECPVCSDVE